MDRLVMASTGYRGSFLHTRCGGIASVDVAVWHMICSGLDSVVAEGCPGDGGDDAERSFVWSS